MALHDASPDMRKSILKAADKSLVQCLCEICYNMVIKGAVNIPPAHKTKLSRHKKILRSIARKGEAWTKKKKLLLQSGGAFLPILLGPLLGAVLGKIFN
jgi:hypothetical protein